MKKILLTLLPLLIFGCSDNKSVKIDNIVNEEIEEITDYIPIEITIEANIGNINNDNVNFRTLPSLDGEIISQLHKNQNIEIYSRSLKKTNIDNEEFYWYLIKSEYDFGWIYGKYIDNIPSYYSKKFEIYIDREMQHIVYSIEEEKGTTFIELKLNDSKYLRNDSHQYYFNSFERNTFSRCAPPGLYKFDSNGNFIDFDFNYDYISPGNIINLSPTNEYLSLTIGVGSYGHGYKIVNTNDLSVTVSSRLIHRNIIWISDKKYLYNKSENIKRNWGPYDSSYSGISIYDIESLTEEWLKKADSQYNYVINSLNNNELLIDKRSYSQGYRIESISVNIEEYMNEN